MQRAGRSLSFMYHGMSEDENDNEAKSKSFASGCFL